MVRRRRLSAVAARKSGTYRDVVLRYLRSSDIVLDVGSGAGERLRELALSFGHGLGIDADPEMVRMARDGPAGNLSFRVCSERLESVSEVFDVILDRHAPFDLDASRLTCGLAAFSSPSRSASGIWPA